MWNLKRASFLLGVGAFRPRFYRNGVIPCQNVDTIRVVDCATTLPLEFIENETLYSRTFDASWSKFLRKPQIWVSKPHFWKVRGDARPWLMARWRTHGQLYIRVNWTFFAIYGCGVIRRNVYSSAVFTGDRDNSLHSNFTWTGLSPSTILGTRKLKTLLTKYLVWVFYNNRNEQWEESILRFAL